MDIDAPDGRAVLDDARLRRLLEVGRSLVAELELDAVLRRVLDVARELTGARYAALGVLDEAAHGPQPVPHAAASTRRPRAGSATPRTATASWAS